MPRLSRNLHICTWTGIVGCVLLVAAFVWSGWSSWYGVGFDFGSERARYALGLYQGCLTFGIEQQVGPIYCRNLGWHLAKEPPREPQGASLPSRPAVHHSKTYYGVDLPLWLAFIALLLPTLLLWWRDRRQPRPGFCSGCDYNLTGNTTGRCPECGLEFFLPAALTAAARRAHSASMRRLSRNLRVCRWACTVGCLLGAAAFCGSRWWDLEYRWKTESGSNLVWLGKGGVFFSSTTSAALPPPGNPGWRLLKAPPSDQQWVVWAPGVWRSSANYRCVYLPLWVPFALFLLPTLLLWRHERHEPQPAPGPL